MGLSAAGAARREQGRAAGISMGLAGLLALLALSLCSVVTRGSAWSFSWSYILGWVGVVLISSAGLFHLCAAAKDPTPESSESGGG
ncbi:lens fiber membrane intrinsic protein isoform X2 [Coturnix japonica]|nr:lens fiber membrane intrinsic protein isoform X2 [Coturnix japonica]